MAATRRLWQLTCTRAEAEAAQGTYNGPAAAESASVMIRMRGIAISGSERTELSVSSLKVTKACCDNGAGVSSFPLTDLVTVQSRQRLIEVTPVTCRGCPGISRSPGQVFLPRPWRRPPRVLGRPRSVSVRPGGGGGGGGSAPALAADRTCPADGHGNSALGRRRLGEVRPRWCDISSRHQPLDLQPGALRPGSRHLTVSVTSRDAL